MRKVSKPKNWLFVEVLQNGIPMAHASYRVGRRKTLHLTSSSGHPLSLPFYPLSHDIELFQIRGRFTRLLMDEAWDGFLHLRGEPVKLNPHQRGSREFDLHPGDFGSIVRKDLRVVFRVGKEIIAPATKYSSQESFAAPLMSHFFRGRKEVISMAVAALGALAIIGALVGFIRAQHLEPPRAFVDIGSAYTLPFIDPAHILTSPEALQTNLDRRDFIKGAVSYYDALAEMLTRPAGPATERRSMMYESSMRSYAEMLKARDAATSIALDEKRAAEESAKSRPGAAILAIPSVVGESGKGMAERVLDKIDIIHESLRAQEKARLLASEEHVAAEALVDNDFRKAAVTGVSTSTKEKMAAFGAGGRAMAGVVSNADHMTKVATDLAKEAAYRQSRILATSASPDSAANAAPLGIESDNASLTFTPATSEILESRRLPEFHAATFGEHNPKAIREPLVGTLDKGRVEEVITRNRYQLQLCYETALRRRPELSGIMEWRWRVDSRGDISELGIRSTSIGDQAVIDCMRQKIGKWRFPRPRHGAVEIIYPFEFTPAKG